MVPANTLVDGEIAVQAAIEFLTSVQKPTCVRWFDL
ncbi:MAG: hypothetical protein LBG99_07230 [Propionibacteriaceae bacterium]|nr:hypothetical protein [Propionibacteriaceae bacterium]